jgi:hypothetical protein
VKVVYIAGPYRAKTEWQLEQNIRHAERISLDWWRQGWAVICPHKNTARMGGACDDDIWLSGDLELLRRCDAICMLNGWDTSIGAQVEYNEARKQGIRIYFEDRSQ